MENELFLECPRCHSEKPGKVFRCRAIRSDHNLPVGLYCCEACLRRGSLDELGAASGLPGFGYRRAAPGPCCPVCFATLASSDIVGQIPALRDEERKRLLEERRQHEEEQKRMQEQKQRAEEQRRRELVEQQHSLQCIVKSWELELLPQIGEGRGEELVTLELLNAEDKHLHLLAAHATRFPRLRELTLVAHAGVSDEGVRSLAALTWLERLVLKDPHSKTVGVSHPARTTAQATISHLLWPGGVRSPRRGNWATGVASGPTASPGSE